MPSAKALLTGLLYSVTLALSAQSKKTDKAIAKIDSFENYTIKDFDEKDFAFLSDSVMEVTGIRTYTPNVEKQGFGKWVIHFKTQQEATTRIVYFDSTIVNNRPWAMVPFNHVAKVGRYLCVCISNIKVEAHGGDTSSHGFFGIR